MTLGDWIREERKKAGLTQGELAERIGVTSATITRYEKGQREPNYSQLLKIEKVLNARPGSVWHNREISDTVRDAYTEEKVISIIKRLNVSGKFIVGQLAESLSRVPALQKEPPPQADAQDGEEE